MRNVMTSLAVLALVACSQPAETTNETNAADANAAMANAVVPAAFQLNETSWTFTRDGKDQQESIDALGNYIVNSGEEHVDHGTAVMKGDKACFTSAMTDEGEECWTTAPTEVGQSFETTSDKGEKLTVTRVAYAPLTM